MSGIAITFVLIVVALGLFIWGRVPAVIVAIGMSLALFFTGILSANQALAGFGDPTVILIASLFVVTAGLEASGITTWAGQLVIKQAGESRTKLMLLIMLLAALFCATISVNGTVAALLPLCVVVSVRLKIPTSQLLLPMCFATHGSSMLTLIGAPLNVIASNTTAEAGLGRIGFFEFAIAGVPMFLGTIVIILLTRKWLLPHKSGGSLPPDLSRHARTLVEQYRLEDGLHRLRVRSSSPYCGASRETIALADYAGISLVAIEDGESGKPLARPNIAEGDVLLVRGDAQAAGRLAGDMHLAFRSEAGAGALAETLFNRRSGLAEVVVPPRSKLVGEIMFPGMAAPDGELLVLAVQRGGEDLGSGPTALAVGDHLLLQGTWQALDKHLADPQVMVVDSPEVVRRQAVPLGLGAKEAIGILVLLVILLATGWVPGAIAALVCAVLMVILGVVTVPQAYRGIDWNTCFLIGGMIPLGAAMTQTGAAQLIADTLIHLLGASGPRVLLTGLFVAALALGCVISNTATALLFFPIAIATAHEIGVSPMPFVIGLAIASHAALLTPVATPVNLMVMGPGGYKFADYSKFGLPIACWWLLVALFIVPLYWRF
ncbi:MAG TPA: SLC13 family permease [Xanthobacteraceae bacterium]|jgi:di/tricarboxylate transporter